MPPTQPDATRARKAQAAEIERPAEGTLGQHAYDCIRSDILRGHFAPGSPLRLQALKDRYGLSFSPLREALNRLQSEQLVSSVAARGFRVTDISVAEMWDAIETRTLIDGEGLRRSIQRGDDDWEAQVLGTFHALSRVFERAFGQSGPIKDDDRDLLETRHAAYHRSLISASGSDWMLRFSTQLYQQTQRYRWPFFSGESGDALLKQSYLAEHREIAEHAVARREDEAVALLARSLHRTGEVIEELHGAAKG